MLTPDQRLRQIQRNQRASRRELIPILLRARERITERIARAVRRRNYSTVKRVRVGLERDLARLYRDLNGDLDQWASRSIRKTSKDWHQIAKKDLRTTPEDIRIASWASFSSEHLEDYVARINPFNKEYLAATQTLNPELAKMARRDINALRSAVLEVFTEAEAAGMTPVERYNALVSRTMSYADDPASWQFIDAGGRRWKKNNYFAMVNRTVPQQAARSSYNDALKDSGRDTVRIIGGVSSESHPACAAYNGQIVSLTGQTPGLPTLQEYKDAGGFHPNCVHTTAYVSPVTTSGAADIESAQKAPKPKVKKRGRSATEVAA